MKGEEGGSTPREDYLGELPCVAAHKQAPISHKLNPPTFCSILYCAAESLQRLGMRKKYVWPPVKKEKLCQSTVKISEAINASSDQINLIGLKGLKNEGRSYPNPKR